MNFQPWALLMAVPPGIVLAYLLWAFQRENRRKKDPLKDRGLRPPGEWLRVRIEELDELMMMRLFYLATPMFVAVVVATYSHTPMLVGIVLFLISTVFSIVTGLMLRSTLNEYRRCRLGFSGERAVGHHLNQLAANGYRIYHDLQFGDFNIDHVLIGPSGVYSVETKTFKKGKGIITLIDGRAAIVVDVTDAPQPVRNYVAHWFREILGNSDFQDAFPGHLSALSRARTSLVLQRFQAIASL